MPTVPFKRVLLFGWVEPGGGWNDFRGSFDTVKQANTHWLTLGLAHKQFIDRNTGLPTDT